jgi:hypothetical protein
MKRLLTAAAVLMCLTAVPLFALDAPADRTAPRDRTTVIDDVIRMSQAGVSDDAIVKFIHESRDRYVVDADVVIALTDAHVSKTVINAVMDEAYARDDDRDDRRSESRRTTVYVRPSYAYDPWFSPYWYDPYWYGPRLSVGFGFGYYGGYRGGYRGHVGGGHHFGGGHGGGHTGGGGGRGHH